MKEEGQLKRLKKKYDRAILLQDEKTAMNAKIEFLQMQVENLKRRRAKDADLSTSRHHQLLLTAITHLHKSTELGGRLSDACRRRGYYYSRSKDVYDHSKIALEKLLDVSPRDR